MNSNPVTRYHICFIGIACGLILLTSCMINPQPGTSNGLGDNQDNITPTKTSSIATVESQKTVIPTQTNIAENTKQIVPTITVTPIQTITVTPLPKPTISHIECDDVGTLPIEVIPTEVSMEDSLIVVDESMGYLAVDKYIGVFDISEPVMPEFLGFWEMPNLPKILDMELYNGVAYVTSGDNTLHLLNLSPKCRFATIKTVEMPFEIFQLEGEESRIYVGGYLENQNQLHITILSIEPPVQPEELGEISLEEPALWSVEDETLYFLKGNELLIAEVSNPDKAVIQRVNIMPNEEVLSRSWPKLVGDTLFLLSDADGFFIISQLGDTSPITKHNPLQYILVGIFEVQDNYIFLGYLGCEGGEVDCNSTAYVLNVEDGMQISNIIFPAFGDVYRYKQIQQNLVYAFSEDSLLVIDLSNKTNPEVVNQVPFIQ